VIGAKEAADDQVALRVRDGRRLHAQPADEILIGALIEANRTNEWDTAISS
jgi:threonyl-tRNA synthetase